MTSEYIAQNLIQTLLFATLSDDDLTDATEPNTFYRIKTIFGRSFMSRIWKNQEVEAKLIANLLNEMTRLGMPMTEKIS